jgi:hypothetical protein
VATAVIAVAIALPPAVRTVQFDRLVSETDNRVVVARWFTEHVAPGSSVLQSGSQYGHVQFDPRLEYKQWVWHRSRGVFLLHGAPPAGRPDWILVQHSPLPSETQAVVRGYLQEDYVLAAYFEALSLKNQERVFDRQDAFFVPFAGFDGVKRPGPNFAVYKRMVVPGS